MRTPRHRTARSNRVHSIEMRTIKKQFNLIVVFCGTLFFLYTFVAPFVGSAFQLASRMTLCSRISARAVRECVRYARLAMREICIVVVNARHRNVVVVRARVRQSGQEDFVFFSVPTQKSDSPPTIRFYTCWAGGAPYATMTRCLRIACVMLARKRAMNEWSDRIE